MIVSVFSSLHGRRSTARLRSLLAPRRRQEEFGDRPSGLVAQATCSLNLGGGAAMQDTSTFLDVEVGNRRRREEEELEEEEEEVQKFFASSPAHRGLPRWGGAVCGQ